MYRITNVTDREGNIKQEFIDEMKVTHPKLVGKIRNKAVLKSNLFIDCLYFDWTDDSNKVLRTSMVMDYIEDGDKIVVTTMNSIYTFEKAEELNKHSDKFGDRQSAHKKLNN